jgi:hypothetical protein
VVGRAGDAAAREARAHGVDCMDSVGVHHGSVSWFDLGIQVMDPLIYHPRC